MRYVKWIGLLHRVHFRSFSLDLLFLDLTLNGIVASNAIFTSMVFLFSLFRYPIYSVVCDFVYFRVY